MGLLLVPFHIEYELLLVDCPFLNILHGKLVYYLALIGQIDFFWLEVDLD